MSFKQSIKEARLKVGLSQAKAGNAINRTRNAIEGYEKGISSPNPDQLVKLCTLYKTTPNDLLEFQCQQQKACNSHYRLSDLLQEITDKTEAMCEHFDVTGHEDLVSKCRKEIEQEALNK